MGNAPGFPAFHPDTGVLAVLCTLMQYFDDKKTLFSRGWGSCRKSACVLGNGLEESMLKKGVTRQVTSALLMAVLFGIAFFLAVEPARRGVAPAEAARSNDAVPGEVIVQFQEMVSLKKAGQFLADQGYKVIGKVPEAQVILLKVPEGEEQQVIRKLLSTPLVKYAEPNYRLHAFAGHLLSPVTPNDTYWNNQWGMRAISAPDVWGVVTGTQQVVVGIIDSGIDDMHPEFRGRILPGYDFVNHDDDPFDDYWHGTHVAGIVAAMGNNNRGVAGVAWGVKLRAYKVLDHTGYGSYYDLMSALYRAINDGVRIVNISLGGREGEDIVREAVRKAHDAGILVVAATGNESAHQVYYPAAYPGVLAVGATNIHDRHATYSNYGDEIDLSAPGGDGEAAILSTIPHDDYSYAYGTSMAAPHVAGAAALLFSLRPDLTNDQVAEILEESCDKVGQYLYDANGWNQYLGHGRINLKAAILKSARKVMPPRMKVAPDSVYFLTHDTNYPIHTRVLLRNESKLYPISWSAAAHGGVPWLELTGPISGTLAPEEPRYITVTMLDNGLPFGVYTGTVTFSSTEPDVQGLPYTLTVTFQYTPNEIRQYYIPYSLSGPASSTAQELSLGDDEFQRVELPFPIRLPGSEREYTTAWVASNGFVTFLSPAVSRAPYRFPCHAIGGFPATVYALGTDLDPSSGGEIEMVKGKDFVEFAWKDVPFFRSENKASFRLVLHRKGTVEVFYDRLPTTDVEATVGIVGPDGKPVGKGICPGKGEQLSSGVVMRWR